MPACHIAIPKYPSGTGFVYICPGRHEEEAGYPCAGPTGRMLEKALTFLHLKLPTVFPNANRVYYLITNGWARVEYMAKTGRTVPDDAEITSADSVARLYGEVRELRHLVACGKPAHKAVERCHELFGLQAFVAKAAHTSQRGLRFPTREHLPVALDTWSLDVVRQLQQSFPYTMTSGS